MRSRCNIFVAPWCYARLCIVPRCNEHAYTSAGNYQPYDLFALRSASGENDRQANMYRSMIAIYIALVTAALVAILTEPRSSGQSVLSQPGLSVIVRAASKADRLDLRAAPICSPKATSPNAASEGARRHQPPRFRSSQRIVLVGVVDRLMGLTARAK